MHTSFMDVTGDSEFYKSFPIPDDPEMRMNWKNIMSIVCAYSDGERIYFKCDSTNESGQVVIPVIDEKTYELIQNTIYEKDSEGKTYLHEKHHLECGIDAPDMYIELKTEYSRTAKNTMRIEGVIDPGTDNERRISMVIPKGASFINWAPSGYETYLDPEGKTAFKEDEWDDLSDLTMYYIKTES